MNIQTAGVETKSSCPVGNQTGRANEHSTTLDNPVYGIGLPGGERDLDNPIYGLKDEGDADRTYDILEDTNQGTHEMPEDVNQRTYAILEDMNQFNSMYSIVV